MTWEFRTEPDFEEKLRWARAFVRDEVMALEVLDLDDAGLGKLIRPLQEEVRKHGLWAVFLPPHLGGSGWGQVKMALLSEVLGEALWAPAVFGSRAPDSGNAELLAIGATARQRDRYLRPLLDGEIRSCFAMTEPDAGSDPTRIATTARPDGDGWLISGHKWFASNASVAEFLLVMCVTDRDAPSRKGQSIFLVPRGTPGLTVVRNIPALDDHNPYFRAPQPDQHAEVLLEDVRVTRENLVGELGQGWELAQARLGPGRIHHCMRWIGQANRAFRMLCERAVSREAGGSRLADKQLIQHYVAQSAAQMQAARLMTLHAAWVIDTDGIEAARTDISIIKFFGAQVLHDVIDRALQVHGSLGYSADMPLEWMYRLARAARIYDGPDEIHEALVARRLLKRFSPVQVPTEHIPTRRLAAERRLAATTTGEGA
jgi:acyl-CoA dehydrogenase